MYPSQKNTWGLSTWKTWWLEDDHFLLRVVWAYFQVGFSGTCRVIYRVPNVRFTGRVIYILSPAKSQGSHEIVQSQTLKISRWDLHKKFPKKGTYQFVKFVTHLSPSWMSWNAITAFPLLQFVIPEQWCHIYSKRKWKAEIQAANICTMKSSKSINDNLWQSMKVSSLRL